MTPEKPTSSTFFIESCSLPKRKAIMCTSILSTNCDSVRSFRHAGVILFVIDKTRKHGISMMYVSRSGFSLGETSCHKIEIRGALHFCMKRDLKILGFQIIIIIVIWQQLANLFFISNNRRRGGF